MSLTFKSAVTPTQQVNTGTGGLRQVWKLFSLPKHTQLGGALITLPLDHVPWQRSPQREGRGHVPT